MGCLVATKDDGNKFAIPYSKINMVALLIEENQRVVKVWHSADFLNPFLFYQGTLENEQMAQEAYLAAIRNL